METAKFKMLPFQITKEDVREYLTGLGCTDIKYSGRTGLFHYTTKGGARTSYSKNYLTNLLINKNKDEVNE